MNFICIVGNFYNGKDIQKDVEGFILFISV